MYHKKKWVNREIPGQDVKKISDEAGITPLLARVFLNRGINNVQEIKKFISPSLDDLYNPYLLKDMDMAVERIIKALKECEKIMIYGDYDVDGVTSTSVLFLFLKSIGADVEYYVPDRFSEGYGMSIAALGNVINLKPSLLITVDCGTTSFDEINYMNSLGIDVVITDHHECKESIPDAYAVVNPCRKDCSYPFKELAGVGVVYKFITAICMKLGLDDYQNKFLDLTAIGTIADVVSLTGENRIIVWHGLKRIALTENLGLKTLIESCSIKDREIDSWVVAFALAPRINAAGRMAHAKIAVELFSSSDVNIAKEIAKELHEKNKLRQDTETDIVTKIVEDIEADASLKADKVLIAAGERLHRGVIGIVASKLTERYGKPCVVISIEDGIGKGSGRSIEGFDLFKAFSSCDNILKTYGGHEMAAGITIEAEKIELFRRAINDYASNVLKDEGIKQELMIETVIGQEDLKLINIKQLKLLAPFGTGNPEPLFACMGFSIDRLQTVGEGRHLKLFLENNGFYVDAIGFNHGNMAHFLVNRDILNIVCSLEINSWNSNEKVQLNIKDLKLREDIVLEHKFFLALDKAIDFSSLKDDNIDNDFFRILKGSGFEGFKPDVSHLVPERSDLVAVFRYIRSISNGSFIIYDLFAFSRRVSRMCTIEMNYFKLKKILEIFNELNIIKISGFSGCAVEIVVYDNEKDKKSLEDSSVFVNLQAIKARCEKVLAC